MTAPVDARLERLLGGPMLSALRRRLRRTLGSREAGERGAAFRMTGLSPHEHEILASLMGKKPSISNSILLEIDLIDTALRRAGVADARAWAGFCGRRVERRVAGRSGALRVWDR
ncbi:hypothetical protein LJR029_006863 [Caballeronia sp. LjRoot29]|uniref:hypothetical protein n=1 Tax=Caballeronia sp. LjRoot29 TaxID=3342315 RepID=UPI003ECF3F37